MRVGGGRLEMVGAEKGGRIRGLEKKENENRFREQGWRKEGWKWLGWKVGHAWRLKKF